MATGLAAQTQAAGNGTFQQMVRDAMIAAALSIYNEATLLTGNIKSGTPNASVGLSVALGTAIAANAVVRVGGELLTCTAGAAQGATVIPTTTTTQFDHVAGEFVSPPSVRNHQGRATLARQALQNPDAYVAAFAAALASASGGNLDLNSGDVAVSTGVSTVWDAIAGS